MNIESLGKFFLQEMEMEKTASRECLARIPENLYNWKPHEKSMNMGYLALLVAEIPKWISDIIEKSEIDFITYKHLQWKRTDELVKHFDENFDNAVKALQNVTNEELKNLFYLKNNGVTLFSSPKDENISSSINHWVHHRGQLTVYLRLNNLPVPSIYGPSADVKTF
jgi:uncharacterized damage-inducible protein DinB